MENSLPNPGLESLILRLLPKIYTSAYDKARFALEVTRQVPWHSHCLRGKSVCMEMRRSMMFDGRKCWPCPYIEVCCSRNFVW